jgi:hypothetical protein
LPVLFLSGTLLINFNNVDDPPEFFLGSDLDFGARDRPELEPEVETRSSMVATFPDANESSRGAAK